MSHSVSFYYDNFIMIARIHTLIGYIRMMRKNRLQQKEGFYSQKCTSSVENANLYEYFFNEYDFNH